MPAPSRGSTDPPPGSVNTAPSSVAGASAETFTLFSCSDLRTAGASSRVVTALIVGAGVAEAGGLAPRRVARPRMNATPADPDADPRLLPAMRLPSLNANSIYRFTEMAYSG
jgi:hypothetical protein